jgi:hypothetical protein
MKTLTFDELPGAIMEMNNKLDRLIGQYQNKTDDVDKLLDLNQLIEYLPERPAKQTIYCKVNDRRIPYEKHGKKLYFRKSIIDKWCDNGRQM